MKGGPPPATKLPRSIRINSKILPIVLLYFYDLYLFFFTRASDLCNDKNWCLKVTPSLTCLRENQVPWCWLLILNLVFLSLTAPVLQLLFLPGLIVVKQQEENPPINYRIFLLFDFQPVLSADVLCRLCTSLLSAHNHINQLLAITVNKSALV